MTEQVLSYATSGLNKILNVFVGSWSNTQDDRIPRFTTELKKMENEMHLGFTHGATTVSPTVKPNIMDVKLQMKEKPNGHNTEISFLDNTFVHVQYDLTAIDFDDNVHAGAQMRIVNNSFALGLDTINAILDKNVNPALITISQHDFHPCLPRGSTAFNAVMKSGTTELEVSLIYDDTEEKYKIQGTPDLASFTNGSVTLHLYSLDYIDVKQSSSATFKSSIVSGADESRYIESDVQNIVVKESNGSGKIDIIAGVVDKGKLELNTNNSKVSTTKSFSETLSNDATLTATKNLTIGGDENLNLEQASDASLKFSDEIQTNGNVTTPRKVELNKASATVTLSKTTDGTKTTILENGKAHLLRTFDETNLNPTKYVVIDADKVKAEHSSKIFLEQGTRTLTMDSSDGIKQSTSGTTTKSLKGDAHSLKAATSTVNVGTSAEYQKSAAHLMKLNATELNLVAPGNVNMKIGTTTSIDLNEANTKALIKAASVSMSAENITETGTKTINTPKYSITDSTTTIIERLSGSLKMSSENIELDGGGGDGNGKLTITDTLSKIVNSDKQPLNVELHSKDQSVRQTYDSNEYKIRAENKTTASNSQLLEINNNIQMDSGDGNIEMKTTTKGDLIQSIDTSSKFQVKTGSGQNITPVFEITDSHFGHPDTAIEKQVMFWYDKENQVITVNEALKDLRNSSDSVIRAIGGVIYDPDWGNSQNWVNNLNEYKQQRLDLRRSTSLELSDSILAAQIDELHRYFMQIRYDISDSGNIETLNELLTSFGAHTATGGDGMNMIKNIGQYVTDTKDSIESMERRIDRLAQDNTYSLTVSPVQFLLEDTDFYLKQDPKNEKVLISEHAIMGSLSEVYRVEIRNIIVTNPNTIDLSTVGNNDKLYSSSLPDPINFTPNATFSTKVTSKVEEMLKGHLDEHDVRIAVEIQLAGSTIDWQKVYLGKAATANEYKFYNYFDDNNTSEFSPVLTTSDKVNIRFAFMGVNGTSEHFYVPSYQGVAAENTYNVGIFGNSNVDNREILHFGVFYDIDLTDNKYLKNIFLPFYPADNQDPADIPKSFHQYFVPFTYDSGSDRHETLQADLPANFKHETGSVVEITFVDVSKDTNVASTKTEFTIMNLIAGKYKTTLSYEFNVLPNGDAHRQKTLFVMMSKATKTEFQTLVSYQIEGKVPIMIKEVLDSTLDQPRFKLSIFDFDVSSSPDYSGRNGYVLSNAFDGSGFATDANSIDGTDDANIRAISDIQIEESLNLPGAYTKVGSGCILWDAQSPRFYAAYENATMTDADCGQRFDVASFKKQSLNPWQVPLNTSDDFDTNQNVKIHYIRKGPFNLYELLAKSSDFFDPQSPSLGSDSKRYAIMGGYNTDSAPRNVSLAICGDYLTYDSSSDSLVLQKENDGSDYELPTNAQVRVKQEGAVEKIVDYYDGSSFISLKLPSNKEHFFSNDVRSDRKMEASGIGKAYSRDGGTTFSAVKFTGELPYLLPNPADSTSETFFDMYFQNSNGDYKTFVCKRKYEFRDPSDGKEYVEIVGVFDESTLEYNTSSVINNVNSIDYMASASIPVFIGSSADVFPITTKPSVDSGTLEIYTRSRDIYALKNFNFTSPTTYQFTYTQSEDLSTGRSDKEFMDSLTSEYHTRTIKAVTDKTSAVDTARGLYRLEITLASSITATNWPSFFNHGCRIKKTDVTNTAPTLTLKGSNALTIARNRFHTYIEPGINATDVDGDSLTVSIDVYTGDSVNDFTGSYYAGSKTRINNNTNDIRDEIRILLEDANTNNYMTEGTQFKIDYTVSDSFLLSNKMQRTLTISAPITGFVNDNFVTNDSGNIVHEVNGIQYDSTTAAGPFSNHSFDGENPNLSYNGSAPAFSVPNCTVSPHTKILRLYKIDAIFNIADYGKSFNSDLEIVANLLSTSETPSSNQFPYYSDINSITTNSGPLPAGKYVFVHSFSVSSDNSSEEFSEHLKFFEIKTPVRIDYDEIVMNANILPLTADAFGFWTITFNSTERDETNLLASTPSESSELVDAGVKYKIEVYDEIGDPVLTFDEYYALSNITYDRDDNPNTVSFTINDVTTDDKSLLESEMTNNGGQLPSTFRFFFVSNFSATISTAGTYSYIIGSGPFVDPGSVTVNDEDTENTDLAVDVSRFDDLDLTNSSFDLTYNSNTIGTIRRSIYTDSALQVPVLIPSLSTWLTDNLSDENLVAGDKFYIKYEYTDTVGQSSYNTTEVEILDAPAAVSASLINIYSSGAGNKYAIVENSSNIMSTSVITTHNFDSNNIFIADNSGFPVVVARWNNNDQRFNSASDVMGQIFEDVPKTIFEFQANTEYRIYHNQLNKTYNFDIENMDNVTLSP